jgi:pyridine nucleotide-disulfide oxidoreductase
VSPIYAVLNNRSSHVAIIGAGVSGMTAAVALAMATGCLVYIYEKDAELLQKMREAAFRYFHPQLNPNAGGGGDSLSGDPTRGTDFPLMNWRGGYGPHVAEQLVRKFNHYRYHAGIALCLKEEVLEIRTRGGLLQLKSNSGQTLAYDIAILATGFGIEKGSRLTNDESYWHSGNPAGYRALKIRSVRSPERILISGNGDSGVIELAHCLIRDFRHHDVFSFLPHDGMGGRLGQSYPAMLYSLVHRRVLATVFNDDEGTGLPLAVGVLGWYWQMRSIGEMNPHINLFGNQPQSSLETQLYGVLHARLSPYQRLLRVPTKVLVDAEEAATKRLHELASWEIQEFAKRLHLQRIFPPIIRRVMRADVSVTMLGSSPTVYSMTQAPINWFLLAVLRRFAHFEYRCERLPSSSRVVHNQIRTQFGIFDRIIARHGPEFRAFGDKAQFHRRAGSVTAASAHQLITHMVVDKARSRWHDVFVDHFRSKRWKSVVRRAGDFNDAREKEIFWEELAIQHRHADSYLFGLRGTPSQEKSILLYRLFKRTADALGRAAILRRLIRLTSREIKVRGHLVRAGPRVKRQDRRRP